MCDVSLDFLERIGDQSHWTPSKNDWRSQGFYDLRLACRWSHRRHHRLQASDLTDREKTKASSEAVP